MFGGRGATSGKGKSGTGGSGGLNNPNETTKIDDKWNDYDKTVAKAQLENYGKIYLDEYGKPIDNEYELEERGAQLLNPPTKLNTLTDKLPGKTKLEMEKSESDAIVAFDNMVTQKTSQFKNMLDRQFSLTSGTGWTGTITQYSSGYYSEIDVTRGKFSAFVDNSGKVVKKPTGEKLGALIDTFEVSGDGIEINRLRGRAASKRRRENKK